MKINDFLSVISEKELIKRLEFLDRSLKYIHQNNYYVSSDFRDMKLILNGDDYKIDPNSIKISHVDEEDNNSKKYDILELTALEICAFNHFVDENDELKIITESDFINSLFYQENLEVFLENVPDDLDDYYREVYLDGQINQYLCNYIDQKKIYRTEIAFEHAKDFSPFYRKEANAYVNQYSLILLTAFFFLLMSILIYVIIS